jgi:hypothetical protein
MSKDENVPAQIVEAQHREIFTVKVDVSAEKSRLRKESHEVGRKHMNN